MATEPLRPDAAGDNQMTILTVQPSSKDTYVRQDFNTSNYGGVDILYITDYDGSARRPIFEFDISELPSGATINSATLQLYYVNHSGDNPSGKTVWAYKLTRIDWVELEATWDIYKTGSNWTASGGDYVTSDPSGGSTTFPASEGAWMSWDVKSIIEQAIADEWSVAEFLVKFETETEIANYSQAGIYSNDYTSDPSLCPKLVIDYTPAAGLENKSAGMAAKMIAGKLI